MVIRGALPFLGYHLVARLKYQREMFSAGNAGAATDSRPAFQKPPFTAEPASSAGNDRVSSAAIHDVVFSFGAKRRLDRRKVAFHSDRLEWAGETNGLAR